MCELGKELGRPEDVAAAAVAASDESRYAMGSGLVVYGGVSSREVRLMEETGMNVVHELLKGVPLPRMVRYQTAVSESAGRGHRSRGGARL